MSTTMTQVFQSRWGFHPASRETDKQLRFLNDVYMRALCAAARWERWHRKQPHNRFQRVRGRLVRDSQGSPVPWAEPTIDPIFSTKKIRKIYQYPQGYVDEEYVETVDLNIPRYAGLSRTPVATEDQVRPLPVSPDEIARLFSQAKQT